ncbi:MAG: hypothetical protein P8012_07305 [Desulfobacterales bacterium]
MNYTIKLSENQRFLEVKATGQINIDIIRQWSKDIEKKSRAMDIRKFLFDVRSARNVSIAAENYFFAHRDSIELNLQRNVRSAILVSETDRSHDFTETTLRNAGYNVRIFTDKSSAVKWLEEDSR